MKDIINSLTKIVAFINDNILWGIPMIIAILGTGVFLSVRTKFLQARKLKNAFGTTLLPTVKELGKKNKNSDKDTISPFEAFSAAISGTVGTGNIVGVAGALIVGGPGAIFWMWISAFFGLVTNYAENVLSLYYRKKKSNGEIAGGPMYYITHGLNLKWLGVIFAICCLLASLGMGMVQANSISGTIQQVVSQNDKTRQIVAWIVGVIVLVLTALIVIGGIKRIGKVTSLIAPFMILIFIVFSFIIIAININCVPKAFALIFQSAFSFKAVGSGFLGYVILTSMRYGFARGIFSNEAGLGSSCIAHAASNTKEPVKQGFWGLVAVFLDTFIVCTLTALTLITTAEKTGIYDFTNLNANAHLEVNEIAIFAFSKNFGTFGEVVFSIVLPLFAFSTIIAWSYYGQKAIEFLFGEKREKLGSILFKIIFVSLILLGSLISSSFVWSLDEMFNALMALPNLIALLLLSGKVVKITKNYFDRKKGVNVEPMLSAYPDQNEEFKKELNS